MNTVKNTPAGVGIGWRVARREGADEDARRNDQTIGHSTAPWL
jgi:hypothetical protein